ncbi:MAG: phosphate ABC transporter substrate-binding protein PstS [Deltaproteobacteria bacterium]|nr:phosphate ABC transporter substrate-binding protein PstS [Deltaproteobacteria bacterium]
MKLTSIVPLLIGALLSIHNAFSEDLTGAGASFPYPLYSKMFSEYGKQYKININYQSIGSGGGIKQLLAKTIDFGGSDAIMSDEQLSKAPGKILHIPTCLGSVVIVYNLNIKDELKLTPDVISDIFLGKIKKWNDPKIAELNKGIKLPDANISVVHRSDGSGTTAIFTDYLSKVSSEWKNKVGTGTSVNWPVGIGGKGNEGVAGLVKQVPNSIGYVELIYAIQNKMNYAAIQNKAGKFIKPTLESTSKAAEIEMPDDMRISITNTDSPDGYPIAGFTYILVYQEQKYDNRSLAKARSLYKLLNWIINEGQKFTTPLHYAPLPEAAKKKAQALIQSITYDGKPIE